MEKLDPTINIDLNYKILLLCASGRSNDFICRTLKIDTFTVVHALEYTINFYGFRKDLDFDAHELYKRQPNLMEFLKEARQISRVSTELELLIGFLVNEKFSKIERKLKEDGYTS